MIRSLSTAVLLLLFALPSVALAQNTGKLSGRVTDAQTGDALIGANVFLPALARGAATDIDGNYTILGIPVGQYDITYSYTGYQAETITGVEISQGRTRQVDVELGSTIIGEVVVEYERPLIQQDAIGVPKVVTGEDIANLPVRGVGDVAAIQAGVVSGSGDGGLNIRGGRTEEVDFYIDGVKVVGSAAVPQQAIAEQEMLIGTIPPQYGDASAGVISISTRSGGNEFFGAVEAITSQGLDSYGYNLGSLSIGGPIVRDFASFFASVQGIYQQDSSPYALETPRLNEDLYNTIQQTPQVFRVDRETALRLDGSAFDGTGALFSDDDFFYLPIPSGFDPTISFATNPDGTRGDQRFQLNAAGEQVLDDDGNPIPLAANFVDLRRELGLSAGLVSGTPIEAVDLISDPNDFTFERGKDDPATDLSFSSNIEFRPVSGVNLRLGGAYTYGKDRGFSFARSLFNQDSYSESVDQVGRGYVSLRQVLSNTAFYQLQAEYSDRFQESYPEAIGNDMADIILYGDAEAEYNTIRSRYIAYDTEDDAFRQAIPDGNQAPGQSFANTFLGPGTRAFGYSKFDQQQFRVFGSAQTQVGVHELSFGGEYETQTQRFYSIFGSQSQQIARSIIDENGAEDPVYNCDAVDDDGNPIALAGAQSQCGTFGTDSFQGDGDPLSDDVGARDYANLPFEAGFDFRERTSYYGYNYLGLEEADSGSIVAYQRGENPDLDIAPYKPIYYGGYVRDRIEYRDLVIDLGVRVDVFDNNTDVLIDPFARQEVVRVRNVTGGDYVNPIRESDVVSQVTGVPDNIDSDFAVLVDGQTVVGYRDRFGQFYNAAGAEVDLDDPTIEGGSQRALGDGLLTEDSFESYEPQLTVMPRVGVTFPITDRALFFASYNVTSQRPSENAFATIADFAQTGDINNPNLKPETTTQYELGFRQALGGRAAFTLSGYYRTQRDKIGTRPTAGAFPTSYDTYRNIDFTTTKGVEFAFDLRRTRNLQVNANYTLSFAEGTGSDSNTARLATFRNPEGSDNYPVTIARLDFDQRHNLNVSLDYRLGDGEGPMVGGVRPFSGFGFNLLGVFKSGNPYTQIIEEAQETDYSSNIGIGADGEVNATNLPSSFRLDLKVDRAFNLGGADLTGYVWVQNLLDTENIVGVYRTTGLPDDDGYLATDPQEIRNLETQLQRDSAEFLYRQFVGGPVAPNVFKASGSSFYSAPRRIRLGVTLGF